MYDVNSLVRRVMRWRGISQQKEELPPSRPPFKVELCSSSFTEKQLPERQSPFTFVAREWELPGGQLAYESSL